MLVCAAADKAPAKPVSKAKPTSATAPKAPATSTAATTSIPAGAVEVEPYLYRYTDKDGKVWLYRKTPFGISKSTEQAQLNVAQQQAAATANQAKVRAIDAGDTVKFERSTAMGKQSWEKKKADLTAEEKGWLAQANAQATAAGQPEK
jgi:hypothetical protein